MIENQMYRDLNLRIPGSLLILLEQQAIEQGVSFEALCLSLLSGQKPEGTLIDPAYYSSLSHTEMRQEVRKVIESGLPKEEVRRRVNQLEFQISKRYIR
jgi:hypothetical protein